MRAAFSLVEVTNDFVNPGARDECLFSFGLVVAPDDEQFVSHCNLIEYLHERLHARAVRGELICRGTRLRVNPFLDLLQFTVVVLILDKLFS